MGIDVNGIAFTASSGTLTAANSGATTAMTVNSNGIITRPQRPVFQGTFSGNGTFYNSYNAGWLNVKGVGVILNTGSCWNNTTGVFTCPVAGKYLSFLSGIATGAANGVQYYGYLYIWKNGGTVAYTHWSHQSYWEYATITAVLDCAASDTISFQILSGNGSDARTGGLYGAGDHSSLGIGMIG